MLRVTEAEVGERIKDVLDAAIRGEEGNLRGQRIVAYLSGPQWAWGPLAHVDGQSQQWRGKGLSQLATPGPATLGSPQ